MLPRLETQRLILRGFRHEDGVAVHSYSSIPENIVYMAWGPSTLEQSQEFVDKSIADAVKTPCPDYQYAVTLKDNGRLIGACGLTPTKDQAEIGWILHRDHWRQGYGTEIGQALLAFGFDSLRLHRIIARCDAENRGSYRIMEKIGMRREGLFLEACGSSKLSDKPYGDECVYAMLDREWKARL